MIHIRNQTFVGVHELIARKDPFQIPSTERYMPPVGKAAKKLSDIRRVRTRRATIFLPEPVHYEIHLASKTKELSADAVEKPGTNIATFFTVHGIKDELTCRNNCTCLIYGPEGFEQLYYVLTWDDVMENPMKETEYTGPAQTKRKLRRCCYPQGSFKRISKGRRVHYLRMASPTEYATILTAIKNA